jgi:hypothetical protein
MAPRITWSNKWEFVRTFGVALAGCFLVAVLLTHALVRIVQERYLNTNIRETITQELSEVPSPSLVDIRQKQYKDKVYVLATVRTPSVIAPDKVMVIQEALTSKVERPPELMA